MLGNKIITKQTTWKQNQSQKYRWHYLLNALALLVNISVTSTQQNFCGTSHYFRFSCVASWYKGSKTPSLLRLSDSDVTLMMKICNVMIPLFRFQIWNGGKNSCFMNLYINYFFGKVKFKPWNTKVDGNLSIMTDFYPAKKISKCRKAPGKKVAAVWAALWTAPLHCELCNSAIGLVVLSSVTSTKCF